MRYAVISDLHANQASLSVVLRWCQENGIDKIVNLGDIVGWGAQPNECCEMLRQNQIPGIAGNHDLAALGDFEPVYFKRPARHRMLWTRAVLREDNKHYLRSLPETLMMDAAFLMVHGSLKSYSQYMLKDETVRESFQLFEQRYPSCNLCFFGHTHRPVAHQLLDGKLTQLTGLEWTLDPAARYLINPGSIGYARYAEIPLSFLVYDQARQTVKLERLLKSDYPNLYKPPAPDVPWNLPVATQYAIFAKRSLVNFVRNRIR